MWGKENFEYLAGGKSRDIGQLLKSLSYEEREFLIGEQGHYYTVGWYVTRSYMLLGSVMYRDTVRTKNGTFIR